jgi:hypothetical protein
MEKIITQHMEKLCLDEAEAYTALILEAQNHERQDQHFTSTGTALKMLYEFPDDVWNEGKTFIDAECGIGQLVVPVVIIKNALQHEDVLSCVFGVDLVENNVMVCRKRVLDICGHTEHNIEVVNTNFVCADSLTYDFGFNHA